MWRSLASNMLTILVVMLFLLGGIILWGKSQFTSEGPLAEAICLQVRPGSNMTRVSRSLEDQGAVSSGAIFRLGAKYTEKSSSLKAGSFLIEPGASMASILDQVTIGGASTCGTEIVYRVGVARMRAELRELDPASGKFVERVKFVPGVDETPALFTERQAESDTRFRIALAEGVTSWQVVDVLGRIDLLSGEVNVPSEGTLAPDSYEISEGDTRASVIERMQLAQAAAVEEIWAARDPSVPLESPAELLTLASIVEKETGVAAERRQVASVFANRLNQGMRLQTDPTVIYGITRGEGVLGRGLRRSELQRETPWNTYVFEGLPPTPIANPGRASLEAAANPDTTPYIFFVADGTGGHAFATTLAEHNRNVAKWRQIEAERAE